MIYFSAHHHHRMKVKWSQQSCMIHAHMQRSFSYRTRDVAVYNQGPLIATNCNGLIYRVCDCRSAARLLVRILLVP